MSVPLFSDLGLSPESLKAIARLGFEQPSPIQAQTVPLILAGHDVVGQSQTGSGKTAAFALPAIERVDPNIRSVQVLILCNTRELAVQVSEETHKLSHFKPGLRPLPVYGGQSYDRQIAGLRSGANIVIGTPGRVMDHMQRGTLVLSGVKMVVLDEADEMLNMGFRDDIEFILKAVPKERQTVLFSATIPRPIEELIAHHTRNPKRVHIDAKALTVPTVEQVYVEVDRRWKAEALERMIDLHDVTRGLIFCNTQRMVDELAEILNAAGYGADAIHGGMAQSQRDRVMKKFKSGGLEFLVATDIAARGIDVDDIQVVFNFDLPYDGEDYVHRIGRTGRAGRSGLAISFVSGRERFAIQQLERFTRQRLRRAEVPTAGEIEQAKMHQLLQSVRATIAAGDFRHYDHLIEGMLEEGIDSLDLANALLHRLNGSESGEAAPKASRAAGAAVVAKPPVSVKEAPVKKPRVEKATKEVLVPVQAKAPSPVADKPTVETMEESESKAGAVAAGPVLDPEPQSQVVVSAAEVVQPAPVKAAPKADREKPSEPRPPSGTPSSEAPTPGRKPLPPIPRAPVVRRDERPGRPEYARPEYSRPDERRGRFAGDSRDARPGPGAGPGRFDRGDRPRPYERGPAPYGYGNPQDRPPRFGDRPPQYGERPYGAGRSDRFERPAGRFERPMQPDRPVRPERPPYRGEKPPAQERAARPPRAVPGGPEGKPEWLGEGDSAARRPVRPKPSGDMTRLWVGVGAEHQIGPGDVKGCILGETGLPTETVGNIDVRERHTFVEVSAEHVGGILSKLKRAQLGGRNVKAKVA